MQSFKKKKVINENLKFRWQKRIVDPHRGKKKRGFALGRIGKEVLLWTGFGVQSLILIILAII